MLQPIVQSGLVSESILLRSCIYRFKLNNFTCTSSRNFHKIPSPKRDAEPEKHIQSQYLSLTLLWHRFLYPSCNLMMKLDNLDSKEWSMIYRFRISSKFILLTVYGHLVASLVALYVLFAMYRGKKYYHKDIQDQNLYRYGLIFGCSLVIMVSILIFINYPKLLMRGYYSGKYQRFILVRPSLIPWQVRKMIVAPGMLEPVQSRFLGFLAANYKVKDSRMFIFERSFFYPTYFNVLCGFSPPRTVQNLQVDAEKLFNDIVKG